MRRQQTVWVCRKTGRVFLDRAEFQEHLLTRRYTQQYERRRSRIIAAGDAFAASCETISELEAWLNNSSFFLDFARLNDPSASSTLANFRFTDIWVGDCSNSHSAPRGLPMNFGSRDTSGLPRNYPGISCNIRFSGSIKTSQPYGCRATDFMAAIGIHTGTGGGGGGEYRYGCTIWAQHFPKLFSNLTAQSAARSLDLEAASINVSAYEA